MLLNNSYMDVFIALFECLRISLTGDFIYPINVYLPKDKIMRDKDNFSI